MILPSNADVPERIEDSTVNWQSCKRILIIRPDNMGDLIMSSPAIRALKESFGATITVLTSSMAVGVARMIPEIDDTIVYDVPWIKAKDTISPDTCFDMVAQLKLRNFDAAVIFTVYSQNSLPTAMLAFLANIPLRLAYCRENPYELLTHWVPDPEPYTCIKHQVRRDLDLVATIGAKTVDERLSLRADPYSDSLKEKLVQEGVDISKPFLILHPGVSEKKREFPLERWVETGKELSIDYQLLITGGAAEKKLTERIAAGIGSNAFSMASRLKLADFVGVIKCARLVISVNTGTIHIAAACQTPMIVLYAFTNPQHFPWQAKGSVLLYDTDEDLRSKNEVIRYVNNLYVPETKREIFANDIISEARTILAGKVQNVPELPTQVRTADKYFYEDQLK